MVLVSQMQRPMETTLFTAGNCPVCSDSGALLCLRSLHDGQLVLFCPLCETAFRERPNDHELDAILTLDEVAPTGIGLPTKDEVIGSPLGPFLEIQNPLWIDFLEPHLRPQPKHDRREAPEED